MQQEFEPSPKFFSDTDPSIRRGPIVRVARAMAARFSRRAADHPFAEPFRDSDFEADSGFLGRPFGEH